MTPPASFSLLAQAQAGSSTAASTGAKVVDAATAVAVDTSSSTLQEVDNLFQSMTTIFSSGNALANTDTLLQGLSSLGMVWAAIFLVVGLLTLFNGYQWYRTATIVTALLLGLFAGYALGQRVEAPFIVAGCLGALFGVVAFPLMKYVVAALGGLSGAFIGANLWSGIALTVEKISGQSASATGFNPNAYWVGALIGLIICGMLAFVLWKLSIVIYTSVSGSTLAVIGGIALLLSFEPLHGPVTEALTRSRMVVPLLVFVPAAIGLVLQELRKEPAGD